jgi:sigma-B regulation protein RsbU (phosphoserine phosphatase)
MPVGLMPGAHFGVEEQRLESGDRLLLYTDGVTEAANEAGEFFGRMRLRAAAASVAMTDCVSVHDTVLQSLRDFTGGAEQSDDITLVVAEYRPEATL